MAIVQCEICVTVLKSSYKTKFSNENCKRKMYVQVHGSWKIMGHIILLANNIYRGKQYQYTEDDFLFKFWLLTSFFRKFTNNQEKLFNWWLLLTCVSMLLTACFNKNLNKKWSLLYWYNRLPLYLKLTQNILQYNKYFIQF